MIYPARYIALMYNNSMRKNLFAFIRRYGLLIPLMLLAFIIGGIVFLAATFSIQRDSVRLVATQIATAPPPLPGTPVAQFAPIDPDIAAFLQFGQPNFGAATLEAPGIDIPPPGAYIPRTGNIQFEFMPPTPLPTPLPYPTSPPLPTPEPFVLEFTPVPTVPPLAPDGSPRTLPYAGESCAPAGLPIDGLLTQRFHAYHIGVDLGAPLGTPIFATHSGQVTFAGWSDQGYGFLIILQNGPYITYYGHQTSFNVSVNQFVGKGSLIGWVGSTGNSTGPHVHYETRINDVPVDPLSFEQRGYGTC
ncbi:MAG: hypothetical protein D6737_09890 [Chloroflexi bacterium]|nr:MAG: hypothetical protein D6737_09890 [Chloroflexota bacterium]